MSSKPDEKASSLIWNLSPLFASDTDPTIAKDLELVQQENAKFVSKWRPRQDHLVDPKILTEALDDYENLTRLYGFSGKVGYYFSLRFNQNQSDPHIKSRLNQVEELARKLQNDIHFFSLNLAKVSSLQQQTFLSSPLLASYHHFLERLFAESQYLLSEAEEKILNLKSAPAHTNWTRMTSTFLSQEEILGQTLPQLLANLSNSNKKLRDKSASSINQILASKVDTAEHELNSILANKKIDDQLRNLPRPDTARHISDDIDTAVVDCLLQTVTSHFTISHRYYAFKAKILGVKKLKYHERLVPFGKLTRKYSFSNSVKLVRTVFSQLDSEFAHIFDRLLAAGQVDVYPRKGKRGGAFCDIDLITHPTYILLNHTDRLTDVLTLAHEMGHALNNELMKQHVHALDFGTPLSTAEVASTFVEDFVLQKLLSQASKKDRLTLLIEKLDSDIATIFRQAACYNFETELHAQFRHKGYLSQKEIGQLFQKHMAAYMGDSVEQSPGSQNWWVHWHHIRSFFYVYSYASGLLISKSLQNFVKKDPSFISNIKDILSAGQSRSPRDIFIQYGHLDIAQPDFWAQGLTEVENLLTQAEQLWKEVKN